MSAADAMVLVVASKGFKDLRAALRTRPTSLLEDMKQRMGSDEEDVSVNPDSEQSGELATMSSRTQARATRLYQALSQAEKDKLSLMVRSMGGGRSDLDSLIG